MVNGLLPVSRAVTLSPQTPIQAPGTGLATRPPESTDLSSAVAYRRAACGDPNYRYTDR